VFHLATCDRLELNGDTNQGAKMMGLSIARESDIIIELAIHPPQPAGLATLSGQRQKLRFQPFAATMKTDAGLLDSDNAGPPAESRPGEYQYDAG
jgi:hypothetical protein